MTVTLRRLDPGGEAFAAGVAAADEHAGGRVAGDDHFGTALPAGSAGDDVMTALAQTIDGFLADLILDHQPEGMTDIDRVSCRPDRPAWHFDRGLHVLPFVDHRG